MRRTLKFPSIRLMSTNNVRSTAASGSQVYESSRAVQEYYLFHYGSESDLMPYSFGPKEALAFPSRCASICSVQSKLHSSNQHRALDLGCSVGGASFELSRQFNEVVGIDFSHSFVEAANQMKDRGVVEYSTIKQGNIMQHFRSELSSEIDRSKVTFRQGDACNLTPDIGKFDVILGSNLLCRLPNPRKFILNISDYLTDSGLLILVSPYSWLSEYTPENEWFGGREEGNRPTTTTTTTSTTSTSSPPMGSFEELSEFIALHRDRLQLSLVHQEQVSFLMREHERKYQYGVSDCTVWKKN